MTLRWLALLVALVGAARMLFEGLRAFRLDEATRASVQEIQRLGAWARVLVESGIEPHSRAVNTTFVVHGLLWSAFSVAYALGEPWARWGVFAGAIASLWYLGLGTLLSVACIVLLVIAGP